MLRNRIAVWDVIASCEITGSADSSIRNVIPNDLTEILKVAKIQTIYVNGGTAAKYYRKYQHTKTGMAAVTLPSTSPANAAWTYEKLCMAWRIIANE